jgi:hypothetical protein
MNAKIFAGAVLAYGYNHWVGNFPSRRVPEFYLKSWLLMMEPLGEKMKSFSKAERRPATENKL